MPFRFLFITQLFIVILYAQDASSLKPNIAVIEFTGDETVNQQQLLYITGKIASELVESNSFTVLDRSRMDKILQEQDFQQSAACSSQECRVQVGQILGVDYIVTGTLVKFGPTYILRIDYINVENGEMIASIDQQIEGDLHEIVNDLCHEGRLKLVNALNHNNQAPAKIDTTSHLRSLSPPPFHPSAEVTHTQSIVPQDAIPSAQSRGLSTKRKLALAIMGTSIAGFGFSYYFDQKGANYKKDYNTALNEGNNRQALLDAGSNMNDMALKRNICLGISSGTALLGLILWFLPENSK